MTWNQLRTSIHTILERSLSISIKVLRSMTFGAVHMKDLAVLGLVLLAIGVRAFGGTHYAGLTGVVGGGRVDGERGVMGVVATWDVGKLPLVVKDARMEWLLAAGFVPVGVLGTIAKVSKPWKEVRERKQRLTLCRGRWRHSSPCRPGELAE